MVQNLELKRILRRLEQGGFPSVLNAGDLNAMKALRGLKLGNRPTNRTGNPELDKMIRKILNRR